MQTIDGKKGTAKPILKAMSAEFRKTQLQSFKKKVDKQHMQEVEKRNEIELVKATYLKYLIIKLRQKISYIAFKNKVTILELFLNAIKRSYNQLVSEGSIDFPPEKRAEEDGLYSKICLGNNNLKGTMASIMVSKSLDRPKQPPKTLKELREAICTARGGVEQFEARIAEKSAAARAVE